jgi:signal transduction histidine kinase
VIDPSRLQGIEPVAARVVAVAADGSALSLQGPVRVPAARQRIAFRFDGVSLSVPERLRFRYRLDGFDHDWSEPTSSREADYTNLAPGSYAFRVRAFGLGEGWMGPESSLSLEVEPALWQRTWVRLAAVLAVAMFPVGLYRFRVRRVIRQLNLRFEERLAERNHIARELHDTLLQGFVSASMQLYVAVEQCPTLAGANASRARKRLVRQVIEEGRNAVAASPAAPDSGDLAEARRCASSWPATER